MSQGIIDKVVRLVSSANERLARKPTSREILQQHCKKIERFALVWHIMADMAYS